jgi:hypothetical protein
MSTNFLELLDINEVKELISDEIKKLALDAYTSNLNKAIVVATEGAESESLAQFDHKLGQIEEVIKIYQAELDRLNKL